MHVNGVITKYFIVAAVCVPVSIQWEANVATCVLIVFVKWSQVAAFVFLKEALDALGGVVVCLNLPKAFRIPLFVEGFCLKAFGIRSLEEFGFVGDFGFSSGRILSLYGRQDVVSSGLEDDLASPKCFSLKFVEDYMLYLYSETKDFGTLKFIFLFVFN